MALQDIATALVSASLLARFRASCLKSAGYVLTEDPGTTDHAARIRWAKRVLSATGDSFLSDSAAKFTRYSLATNATIQTAGEAATDADIDYMVALILGDAATLAFVTQTAAESEF